MDGSIHTLQKFDDPRLTADGQERATVSYTGTKTLWFNTGTLCNIECVNCYIESSPTNDRLVYLKTDDVLPYLDELDAAGEHNIEIGITGGEPFMAPDILNILEAGLDRGHTLLVLTNAMKPMMRQRIRDGLLRLNARFPDKMVLRVSMDHFTSAVHDAERGVGSFDATLEGLVWLSENKFRLAVAGRLGMQESEATGRIGYKELFDEHAISIDIEDPVQLVLFPEMEMDDDPPEITTACWGILDKSPSSVMCANQRMVVRLKGEKAPSVMACTLLPYDSQFNLGQKLNDARKSVSLNHRFCATFCVLGGASCSA